MSTTLSHDTSNLFTAIQERRSVKKYDPAFRLSREEIKELIEWTQKAPSAWNLQHWKFLIFDEQETKEKLLPIAYGQQQIAEASFTVAILADLEANKNAERVYQEAVDMGFMTAEIKHTLISQIEGAYQVPQVARDQAILNASLAAMQLMLAAKAIGLDSCPIGGFNAQQLIDTFNVPSRYIPIMIITVGKAAQPGYPSTRFPVEEAIQWNRF